MPQPLILVTEDEPHLREILCFQLEAAGFRVVPAANGEDALRIAQETRPDLVLTDWLMPGMNGLELTRRIRGIEALARTPVVMLTAKTSPADKVAGLCSGANDYITKPWERDELVARIRNLVEWERTRKRP